MKKVSVILLVMVLLIVVSSGCTNLEAKKQEDYEKCTSVCASVVDATDYVTLHLCNEKCKEEFLT